MRAGERGMSQTAGAPLVRRRFKNPMIALGAAVDLLRPHEPFIEASFGVYASVLRAARLTVAGAVVNN